MNKIRNIFIEFSLVLIIIAAQLSAESIPIAVLTEPIGHEVTVWDAETVTKILEDTISQTTFYKIINTAEKNSYLNKLESDNLNNGLSRWTALEFALLLGDKNNIQNIIVSSITKINDKYNLSMNFIDSALKYNLINYVIISDTIDGLKIGCTDFISSINRFKTGYAEVAVNDPSEMVLIPGLFYIDKYEATNEQFTAFLNLYGKDTDESGNKMVEYNPGSKIKNIDNIFQITQGYDKYPVTDITIFGVLQYLKFYNKRLLTESEWQAVCAGISTTTYQFGDSADKLSDYAWYIKNSNKQLHKSGMKKPNKSGIYDMYGNVWELCSSTISPSGYVICGGAYNSKPEECATKYKIDLTTTSLKPNIGFRSVKQIQ